MRLHTSRPRSLRACVPRARGTRVRVTACPVDPVTRSRRARERGHEREHVCLQKPPHQMGSAMRARARARDADRPAQSSIGSSAGVL